MRSIWILGITLNLIAHIYGGPLEIIYKGDGCECPTKLGYQVAIPKLPLPPQYIPDNYGYKLDVPPIQAKAKVSYTFDFSVQEPKLPCPAPEEKLNLLAKVDRITMNKPDCLYTYAPPPPPPPPPVPRPPSPCSCGLCGVTRPHYRYVNGKQIEPCRCRRPRCKCNLRCPNSLNNMGIPVPVASGSLEQNRNTIRRKRDLHRIFFRPRRQELQRSPRYVKLYHKPITAEKPKEKQDWLNLDFFSDANPFKRKTKKVLFPNFRPRIVKRDIKGEYDLLEKDRQAIDLTIPEIIQFMPETLHPNFKRGPCQFGCRNTFMQDDNIPNSSGVNADNNDQLYDINKGDEIETTSPPTSTSTTESSSQDDNEVNEVHSTSNSFTKRNANGFYYQSAVPPITYTHMTSRQNDYAVKNTSPSPTNPNYSSAPSFCEQRKLYANMRRASESQYIYNRAEDKGPLRLLVSTPRSVPNTFYSRTPPFQYTGDLDIPKMSYNPQRDNDPTVGAPNYPVEHIPSSVLDRIISDIVYRHPEFIEATSHYGGALVDPEPDQAEQTKDFIRKLIDGRLSLIFDEPDNEYVHYYPVPQYGSNVYNPYISPRPLTYLPAIY